MTNKNHDNQTDIGSAGPLGHETFIQLLTANHKRIYGFIRLLVPHRSDTDDIMQETVLTMWRKFDTFTPGSHFAAWGITIARFHVKKFIARHPSGQSLSEEVQERIHACYEDSLQGVDERAEALEQCITRLRNRDAAMVELRYEQGLTAGIIADRLGMSVHGIYKALGRIHGVLQQCVRRRLKEWGAA